MINSDLSSLQVILQITFHVVSNAVYIKIMYLKIYVKYLQLKTVETHKE